MTDHDNHGAQPPIRRWWPHLSIEAKHAVLADPRRPLTEAVLDEIEHITGQRPDRDRLDDEERDFVETQTEAVD